MKEATAINVGGALSTLSYYSHNTLTVDYVLSFFHTHPPVHVQEFKKELTREVMLMTQEVNRLQRERQGMEQQIADLFAFYGRQKAQIMVSPVILSSL